MEVTVRSTGNGLFVWLRRRWCRWFHRAIFRPRGDIYTCAVCLEEWPVSWLQDEISATADAVVLSVEE